MIVTGEMLWPMNMRLFINYYRDVILSTGCSIDDRDSRSVVAKDMNTLISYCHDVILSADSSVDDRGRGSVVANEYEIAYQLLSRYDSFRGLFD